MMTRPIWDGTGELRPDEVSFTTNDGTIRGRPYVRERARRALAQRTLRWPQDRRQAIHEETLRRTVDDDGWLAWRAGMLVAAVCRDVVDAAWEVYLDGEEVTG